jgi:hypothetical protein
MRLILPMLNDTEFGFYYMKYHSRLPVISSITGTAQGAMTAGAVAASAVPIATAVGTHLAFNPGDIPGAIAAGTVAGVSVGAPQQASQAIAATAATGGDVASVTGAFAQDAYVKTARYRTEYPEDIELFGISFNSMLGRTGVALQGEVSYRDDAPLQVDDIELLYATLSPINPALGMFNQVGDYTGRFETDVDGYILRDVIQLQMTATKLFGPMLGANQFVVVGEGGWTHVDDMPSKSELRLEGSGTYVSGNPILGPSTHPGKPIEKSTHYADEDSYGYRVVFRLDYNNAFRSVNLSPKIGWRHDVRGISPGPGGNFIEGRKAVSLGIGATYQYSWSADLTYTNYFGAGRHNLINDRDFISFNIKFSF